jgi:hypothetical protein
MTLGSSRYGYAKQKLRPCFYQGNNLSVVECCAVLLAVWSRPTLAGQPDNAGMSVETIAHPTDGKGALALLTEMPALVSTDAKSSAPILEKERSCPQRM